MVSFQLTAARRRLGALFKGFSIPDTVSTHSRPKAAGQIIGGFDAHIAFQLTAARRRLGLPISRITSACSGFNSQPPEGGWFG